MTATTLLNAPPALLVRGRFPVAKGLLWIALTGGPVLEGRAGEAGEVRPRCVSSSANGLVLIASDRCVRELRMQEGKAAFTGAIATAIEGAQATPGTGNSARALIELGDKSYWQNPPKWGGGSKPITEPYFGKLP